MFAKCQYLMKIWETVEGVNSQAGVVLIKITFLSSVQNQIDVVLNPIRKHQKTEDGT